MTLASFSLFVLVIHAILLDTTFNLTCNYWTYHSIHAQKPLDCTHAHKTKKYEWLVCDLETSGPPTSFLALEISALGHYSPKFTSCLHCLLPIIAKSDFKHLLDKLAKLITAASIFKIFLSRRAGQLSVCPSHFWTVINLFIPLLYIYIYIFSFFCFPFPPALCQAIDYIIYGQWSPLTYSL